MSSGDLEVYLRQRLPYYMVPTSWLYQDSFPLTGNGKIDRRKLSALWQAEASEVDYLAPEGEKEELLAEIWSGLLGVERVGRQDNFFELGGHSLLAMRLVAAIRRKMQTPLSVRAIFEHPTLSQLSLHLSGLQKTRLTAPLIIQAKTGPIPLSFAQERLWFIDQLEGSEAYHISTSFQIEGALDKTALQKAFTNLIARHDILRTIYYQAEGQAYQRLITDRAWQLRHSEHWDRDWVNQAFDLSQDFPLRAYLVEEDTDRHLLLIVLHHIAADGWSLAALVQELVELYRAKVQDKSPELTALPIQYADYAIWQRQHWTSQELHQQLDWWEGRLKDAEPLKLPRDFPRQMTSKNQGALYSYTIDQAKYQALKQWSLSQRATLFMTLLTAFKVLLYRYTGQTDISIGTPVANRSQEELEHLIGCFVNTIVLRSHWEGKPTFGALLEQTKRETLEAYTYQSVPFEKVVERLSPDRKLGENPLFQVMFVLNNIPTGQAIHLDHLSFEPQAPARITANFDLSLNISASPQALKVDFEYNTQLFHERTIKQMGQHFHQLLDALLENAACSIDQLPMLSAEEKDLLMNQFNPLANGPLPQHTVIELFQKQVEKSPAAIALYYGEEALNYRDLDRASDVLGQELLQKNGAGHHLIGLCMNPSTELIIAMLAILKIGKAYLPIDPLYPSERMAYLLEDSGLTLLLSSGEVAAYLHLSDAVDLILVDQKVLSEREWSAMEWSFDLQQLAYVMYTSGSTGRPKGVMIDHLALVDYALHCKSYFEISPEDTILQQASIAFDTVVEEVYPALISGASIRIDPDTGKNMESIKNWIAKGQLSLISTTPMILHELNQEVEELGRLRCLISGGELLRKGDIDRLFGQLRLVNTYGPTETTVCATYHDIEQLSKTSLIGRPIHNRSIWILGPDQNLLPIGAVGEICIAGLGLAKGYWNRPELSAQKFIDHPFVKGEKMYRTGDRGRWLANGQIEFMGRQDDQVKIRAYRIELGEIEAVLNQVAGIRQSVIRVSEQQLGHKQLLAYIVLENEALSKEEIRQALAQQLPQYMIPSGWIFLDQMPLNAHGKIDRQALPQSNVQTTASNNYRPPQTIVEKKLVDIWKTFLQKDRIGLDDNFFDLGGHSLLAVKVLSAARKALEVAIPLRVLFQSATLGQLAAYIEQHAPKNQGLLLRPQDRKTSKGLLSFAQERLWLIDQLEGSVPYHISTVLNVKGPLNRKALESAFQQIIERHEVLRTVYNQEEGRAIQEVRSNKDWQILDETKPELADPKQWEAWLTNVLNRPFNLAKDSMIRVHLAELGQEEFTLVIILHHIAADGWSMAILIDELLSLYQSTIEDQRPNLPALPIQYWDYAHWQRKVLDSQTLSDQLLWWEKELLGAASLELPTDFSRPSIQSTRGGHLYFELDAPLTTQIRQLAKGAGATLFMTLLAAFKILLHKYSGQNDISIGTPVAQREQEALERLIGFFVNTLVLRSRIQTEDSFAQLLAQVKRETLEAFAHQEVPFEQVVERLAPERDMSRSPLFQVMFALQNIPVAQVTEQSDITFSLATNTAARSKFDLSLMVVEQEEGLGLEYEYCSDLFLPESIERLQRHFEYLLRRLMEQPQTSIRHLSLMSPDEEKALLQLSRHQAIHYPKSGTILSDFAQQVLRQPHARAISFESTSLSYRELDAKSNQLAHYLIEKGLVKGSLLMICLERSLEMMIALLGAMKAGGVYVPVDPDYPSERIAYMLLDTAAEMILCTTKQVDLLKEVTAGTKCQILNLEDLPIEQYSDQPPPITIDPSDPIYAIYTSGSTGRPKGVVNEHRGLYNRMRWGQDYFQLQEEELVLQKTTFCFDVSGYELYWPLMVGAELVFAHPEGHKDPAYLQEIIRARGITTIHFVPSMLEAFLWEVKAEDCASLRRVICSGEALKPGHVKLFRQHFPHTALINLYGPTEASIEVSHWEAPLDVTQLELVPIGKPVPNIHLPILDEDGQLLPIGLVGELHIGGVQVARGYLNKSVLTHERFIPDPFYPGQFLYRTGDLAKRTADGNILYMGRTDHQVKIRGYRIELGEIEQVLSQYEAILSSVVLAPQDAQGNRKLLAYVVGTAALDTNAVEAFLRQHLPSYMIPRVWIKMEALPLNSNGKVDRKALPAPEAQDISRHAYRPPVSPAELALADIWKELLRVDPIGLDDNFFELGGDSIISIQVVSKAHQKGYGLRPRDLFEHQTLRELALAASSAQLRLTGEQGRLEGPVGLLPIQARFFEANYRQAHHYNQSVLLQLDKSVRDDQLQQAIALLLDRHDSLRLRFEYQLDKWEAFYGERESALAIVDWQAESADWKVELEKVCTTYQERMDLQKGILIWFVRIKIPATSAMDRLFIVAHHLCMDGVSWRILLADLNQCLTQIEPNFTKKSNSYRQWQEALSEYAKSPIIESQLPYWESVLQAEAMLPVEKEIDREPLLETVKEWRSTLPADLTQSLLQEAHFPFKTSINDLLLSALVATLCDWAKSEELVIGLEGHGREDWNPSMDIAQTIGWFTTLYPVRLQWQRALDTAVLIKQTKEQLRSIPHNGLGYGLLRYLHPSSQVRKSLQSSSNWEVIFNYLGQLDQVITASNSPIQGAFESTGPNIGLQNRTDAKLEINCAVSEGALQCYWSYSSNQFEEKTIRQLADRYLHCLSEIISYCLHQEVQESTPSDFGLESKVSHSELDAFLKAEDQGADIDILKF
ncbi:MAG: amino acid adenylation domain-containing protein [Bacteroidota bacterium]